MAASGKLIQTAIAAYNIGDYRKVKTLCRKMLKRQADNPAALTLCGLAELRLNQPEQAVAMFERVVLASPNECVANYNLGLARFRAGFLDKAVSSFRRALVIDPGFAQGYTDLALCLKECGRIEEAISAAERACDIDPSIAVYQNNAGVIYEAYGLLDEAFHKYRKAVEKSPAHPVFLKNYGLALLGYGKSDEASRCFRKAIQQSPGFGEAWRHLVMTRHYTSCDDNDIKMLEALRARSDIHKTVSVDILFALGKAYDDCGRYGAAFDCIKAANDFESAKYGFRVEQLREKYSANTEVFRTLSVAGDVLEEVSGLPKPIFVVGLPRSGTSLVERILAGHSRVFGSGERTWLHDLERRLPSMVSSNRAYPECLQDMSEVLRGQLAVDYLTHLRAVSDGSEYVVDKLPANFERLGLIGLLFPTAPVIHCLRDPLDACLSMYFQRFPGAVHYSYDLRHLGEYCCFHDKIMSFWRTWHGEGIFDIRYEELIENPRREAQRLFEFLGLPWEDDCLDNSGRRWVRTASDHQVHGEIYRSSQGKWRRYRDQLAGLKATIDNCDSWDEGHFRDE